MFESIPEVYQNETVSVIDRLAVNACEPLFLSDVTYDVVSTSMHRAPRIHSPTPKPAVARCAGQVDLSVWP